ncbi:hypothetical protein U1Q18_014252 [Sarracenia purpurea var. burkii]
MAGRKMKLPFLFKAPEATTSWPWPGCGSSKTLSFRRAGDVFNSINSACFDGVVDAPSSPDDHSWRTEFSSFGNRNGKFIMEFEEFGGCGGCGGGGEAIESVIRGLRSSTERLFFEPGETRSILEEAKGGGGGIPFIDSEVVEMDSEAPYADFKRSMEEMVEAHGMKNWECFEELLEWYLRVNGKNNHGYIVGAFVDLLIGLAFSASSSPFPSSSSSSSSLSDDDENDRHRGRGRDHDQSSSIITNTCHDSPNSPLSFSSSTFSTSPCSSSLEAEDEIEKTVVDTSSSQDV